MLWGLFKYKHIGKKAVFILNVLNEYTLIKYTVQCLLVFIICTRVRVQVLYIHKRMWKKNKKFLRKNTFTSSKKTQVHISWILCVTLSLMRQHSLRNFSVHKICCTFSVQAHWTFCLAALNSLIFCIFSLSHWTTVIIYTSHSRQSANLRNQSRLYWRLHGQ